MIHFGISWLRVQSMDPMGRNHHFLQGTMDFAMLGPEDSQTLDDGWVVVLVNSGLGDLKHQSNMVPWEILEGTVTEGLGEGLFGRSNLGVEALEDCINFTPPSALVCRRPWIELARTRRTQAYRFCCSLRLLPLMRELCVSCCLRTCWWYFIYFPMLNMLRQSKADSIVASLRSSLAHAHVLVILCQPRRWVGSRCP